MYVRLYVNADEQNGLRLNKETLKPKWKTFQSGFEKLLKLYPNSETLVFQYIDFACRVGDSKTYRRLRPRAIGFEESYAFREPLDAFHDSTQPADWYEGLIKAYVGDGMATDFYREVSTYVKDEETRLLIQSVLQDSGQAEFAVLRVKQIIAAEPSVGGRLALWARRLVGEALIQAQQVAVEREALLELLVGNGDLAGIMRLLTSITDQHEARMASLGLQA